MGPPRSLRSLPPEGALAADRRSRIRASGLTDVMNDARLDDRSLSRLRWRCRRGLLENDLFVERFFRRVDEEGEALTTRQADGLSALMDLSDPDLLDLLLARREPRGELDRADVHEVLALLRRAEPPAPMHPTER